jgi:rhodanese-related sulfurtransferase
VNVSFRREPLGGRRQLHVIRSPGDDPFARHDAAANADHVTVACGDLDVRSEEEYNGGHAAGAFNIPLQRAAGAHGMMPNPNFVTVVKTNFAKDAPIVVACKSGGRSARATDMLVQAGFTRVVNMDGKMRIDALRAMQTRTLDKFIARADLDYIFLTDFYVEFFDKMSPAWRDNFKRVDRMGVFNVFANTSKAR